MNANRKKLLDSRSSAIDESQKALDGFNDALGEKVAKSEGYANKGEYRQSYIIYCDVSKRKDLNEVENIMTLEEINMFINMDVKQYGLYFIVLSGKISETEKMPRRLL